MIKLEKFEFYGHEITCEQALEPTNIIWENKEVKKAETNFRFWVIIAVMTVLGFFYSVMAVTAYQTTLELQYMTVPPNISCANVKDHYGDNLASIAYMEGVMMLTISDTSGA